jgi:SAM-dependent methyltransferase
MIHGREGRYVPEGFIFVACPLCGERRQSRNFIAHDDNWGMEGRFTYGTCSACGVCYENPRPDEGILPHYYPFAYGGLFKDLDGEAQKRIASEVHTFRAAGILRHVNCGSLFDVGCGSGFFMEYMRRNGWSVAGIDTSAAHTAFARDRLLLSNVRTGSWPISPESADRYDVVTMFHVLEHMIDPVSAIKAAHALLKPSGFIVIETPNIQSWPARIFGRHWVTLDAPRHLVLFSLQTLRRCLDQAGFQVVELITCSPSTMEYSESIRYALRAFFRRPSRLDTFSSTPKPDTSVGRQVSTHTLRSNCIDVMHGMERSLYVSINKIANRIEAGCNLFAVARR